MMFFPLEFLQSSESGTSSGSEIDKYIQRVHERYVTSFLLSDMILLRYFVHRDQTLCVQTF